LNFIFTVNKLQVSYTPLLLSIARISTSQSKFMN